MKEEERIFEKIKKEVTEEDLNKINENINNMKKGKLAGVWDKVVLLWDVARNKNSNKTAKILAIAALLYVVLPVDAIPDVIPFLGLADDATIVILAATKILSTMKKHKA